MHRLGRSVEYVTNKDKTVRPRSDSASSLQEAVDYAHNREKTECDVFESAIGCTLETAFEDMLANKKRWDQMDGVQGYHLVQSFAEGELTPELAHRIGLELAEKLLCGKYPAVIATHLNTRCLHNHIVWDSVAMDTGRKYRSNARSYYTEVRALSDRLCRQHGLSVINTEKAAGFSMNYGEWMAESRGQPTWRTVIRQDVDEAIASALTWRQFVRAMEQQGYELRMLRKYPTLKPPGKERPVRFKTLGQRYTPEALQMRILYAHHKIPAGGKVKTGGPRKYARLYIHGRPIRGLKGLRALYYRYLYELGALPRKPQYQSYAVRQDIYRLRIIVSEELPDGVQAQYVAKNRAIFVRNNMSAETTFLAIAREQAAASFDIHDGQYSRNAYTPQSYCAAYVAAKKYGLDVSSFSFERVCQLCSGLEPQAQRRFLSDAKQAAYAVERIVRRGLREMELSVTPEADYSVEQKAAVKESGQPKPGKVKKAAQPERE